MLSLFSHLLLASLCITLGDVDSCPVESGEDEVTIAVDLDVQTWLSEEFEVDALLYGYWEEQNHRKLAIYPLPMAANTCWLSLKRGWFQDLSWWLTGIISWLSELLLQSN